MTPVTTAPPLLQPAMLAPPVINYIREEVARQIQRIKDCLEGLKRERERENYGMQATLTPFSNKVDAH